MLPRSHVNTGVDDVGSATPPADRNIVVVTGASGSIGAATVRAIAARGAIIVTIDRQSLPGDVAALVHDELRVDLRDDQAVGEALARVPAYGELRHLIAVAGGGDAEELSCADPAAESMVTFSRVVENNLHTAFTCVRHAVPLMRRTRRTNGDRSLTMVGSINAFGGYGAPGYSAAKAGLIGLVNALAPMLGPEGIRLNCLSLGTTDTNNLRALAAARGEELDLASTARRTSLRRVLAPRDVAAALVSMTFDLTALTGANIVLDNGQLRMR